MKRHEMTVEEHCRFCELAADFYINEVFAKLNKSGLDKIPVPPKELRSLLLNIYDGTITRASGRIVLDELWARG